MVQMFYPCCLVSTQTGSLIYCTYLYGPVQIKTSSRTGVVFPDRVSSINHVLAPYLLT